MTSKKELRHQARAARDGLNAKQREAATTNIQRHALQFLQKLQSAAVGLYMPFNNEVSPIGLMQQSPNCQYAFPVVQGDAMGFHLWDEHTELTKNHYGIEEAITNHIIVPDVIFTPLLGFDRYGTRLGYGKGYYDRYFANAGKNALRIGLAFSVQLMHELPSDPHDIALHATITERGIMRHKLKR